MTPALQLESRKLADAWMQYEGARLRDYLVSGVEDPRINLQSILSRHFLMRSILEPASALSALMEEEYRFAAVMNWLCAAVPANDPEDFQILLYALRRGADNAEGLPIPAFVIQAFGRLTVTAGDPSVPNYIEAFLTGNGSAVLDTFQTLWREALSNLTSPAIKPAVLEPACGSANDYRFLDSYGLARWIHYTGYDLCAKNIENARLLFPHIRFETGNIFEICAADKCFAFCFVHDLFEHLSLEGLETAIAEICRLTQKGICLGFFNMAEISDHVIRPTEEYHLNTLSMDRMKESFARHGFAAQVLHVGSFLSEKIGCHFTHNPNAYTFILQRRSAAGTANATRI